MKTVSEKINQPFAVWGIVSCLLAVPGMVGVFYTPGMAARLTWTVISAGLGGGAVICWAGLFRDRRLRGATGCALFGVLLAATMLEAVSWMISGKSFGYEFAMHFSVNTLRYALHGYEVAAVAALAYGVAATAASGWLTFRGPVALPFRRSGFWAVACLLGLLILPTPAGEALRCWGIRPLLRDTSEASEQEFERFGIKTDAVDRSEIAASPGRNLILIYLESMESTYLDETLFPGLMPNITRLMKEAVVFENVIPAENAGFTVGAVFSSLAGFELTDLQLSGRHGNDGINPVIGNRLGSLPAVLGRAGYFQSFMNSASLNFVGIYVILKELGYTDLWSAADLPEEARRQLGLDGIWGGCRDGLLLKLAFQKYLLLAREKRPFNLTLLTIDAHHPDGFVAKGGPVYALPGKEPSQLLTAIFRTDKAFGEFVDALKQTPAWEDTVVFVTTDHLAMNGASTTPLLRRNPRRRLIAFALNAGPPRRIAVEGRTFDFAPTIAELLGVKHNYRFPQGESLLGNPDSRRLAGDSPEGRRVLESYLRRKSGPGPGNVSGNVMKIVDSPYPAILIGGVPMPLFSEEYGILAYPKEGECLAVRLGPDGLAEAWRRFDAYGKAESFLRSPGRYVLAGRGPGPDGNGDDYYLAAGSPGAFRTVRAGSPVGLSLPLP